MGSGNFFDILAPSNSILLSINTSNLPFNDNYRQILKNLIRGCLILLVLSFIYPFAVFADVYTLSFQNDIVFNTDERYTNGIGFAWMSNLIASRDPAQSEGLYARSIYSIANSFYLIDSDSGAISLGFKIAQDIYTPSDTDEENLIIDDIPYAGHLYTKYSLFEWGKTDAEETFFKIGIVGPSSGAEISQKTFHRLISNAEPKGWNNQLKDQLTFGVGHTHSFGIYRTDYQNGTRSEWFPSVGFEMGNFMSGLFSGILFLYGENYPELILPAYEASNAGLTSQITFSSDTYSYGWSLNLGLFVNATVYSLILDSSAEHKIEREDFIANGIAGITLYINKLEISFSVQTINMYINDSNFKNSWGGISLSLHI